MKVLIFTIIFALCVIAVAGNEHKHDHSDEPECRACHMFLESISNHGIEASIKALPEDCQALAQQLTERKSDSDATQTLTPCQAGLSACLCPFNEESSSSSSDSDDDDDESSFSHFNLPWSYSDSGPSGWYFWGLIFALIVISIVSTMTIIIILRLLFVCCCRRRVVHHIAAVPVDQFEYHSAPQTELESGLYPALPISENQMPVPVPTPVHIDGTPVPCYYVPAHMTVPPEGWVFAPLPQ